MSESLKDRILQTLINMQKINQEDIDQAVIDQRKKGVGLDKVLIEKGLINENDLLMLLVRELNIPFINLRKYKINSELKEIIPEKVARQYGIVPLSCLEESLTIALADPFNIFVIDDLKSITGKSVDVVMSTKTEIDKTLDAYYGNDTITSVNEISKDIQAEDIEIVKGEDLDEDQDGAIDESEKAPIIRMVNLVIKEAIKIKASDIHIEPMVDQLRVRYRIDGVLNDILNIPKENQNAVVTRIKIMARLDITSSHVPQDGRFKLRLPNKEVDFRVSLLPTIFGQKVVMRILDKSNLSIGLNGLGISETALESFNQAIRKPFGMILVTGPTGSGKSTTLYSIVNELNTIEKNIITVEDPVEFLIDGLTQIQARAEIGLTFAEGLRSILRQSPDIVMVGEIRDNETADIAIKASLTGQLVLSTLHTNDAAGALTRLIDMEVEPFLVASSLVLVSAQRLCRKICSKCKEEVKIPSEVLKKIKYDFKPDAVFYHGKGCDLCKKTGYAGRLSITEVLDVDDEIRRMLISGASAYDIKTYACQKKGMDTLWVDAMKKCLDGHTTLEEVLRVTASE